MNGKEKCALCNRNLHAKNLEDFHVYYGGIDIGSKTYYLCHLCYDYMGRVEHKRLEQYLKERREMSLPTAKRKQKKELKRAKERKLSLMMSTVEWSKRKLKKSLKGRRVKNEKTGSRRTKKVD